MCPPSPSRACALALSALVAASLTVVVSAQPGCGHHWRDPAPPRTASPPHRRGASQVEVLDYRRPAPPPRAAAAPGRPPAPSPDYVARARDRADVRYEPVVGSYVPEAGGRDRDAHPSPPPRPRLAPRDEPPPLTPSSDDPRYGPRFTPDGIAFPYPTDKFFRGFGRCIKGQRHAHEAIDLGGVGPDWGLGTPIRSMGRAEIVFIGLGDDNPELFGEPDRRSGTVSRGRKDLPRKAIIAPYGEVHFFTRTKGRWRSGNIIVTRVLDGPLAGHIVRYLHVAAVHPAVATGVTVEAGQEIALMGGTGVQESAPHLHLDIEAPEGHRVDVAPLLGLAATASCGGVPSGVGAGELAASEETARRYGRVQTATRKDDTKDDEDEDEVGRVWIKRLEHACEGLRWEEDFKTGRYESHALVMALKKGDSLDLTFKSLGGGWSGALSFSGNHLKKRNVKAKKGTQRVVLKARADTEITLKVGDKRGRQPPKDARYQLDLAPSCATAARSRR